MTSPHTEQQLGTTTSELSAPAISTPAVEQGAWQPRALTVRQQFLNDLADERGDPQPFPETRFITCEGCGGEGRLLHGIDDLDFGECPFCKGAGVLEIEVQPVSELENRPSTEGSSGSVDGNSPQMKATGASK